MNKYEQTLEQLQHNPKTWLVTDVAGFICFRLLEVLLKLGQIVVGLANVTSGHQYSLGEAHCGALL